jgi:DEAD/DEAH box helicase domain-containing protein
MFDLGPFRNRIVASREIPPREAEFSDFPARMHGSLALALQTLGIRQLYSHQASCFDLAVAQHRNVVVTTGTASGKSLCYLLPVLQTVLEDQAARAILVYPTKALAQDQLRAVLDLCDLVATSGLAGGGVKRIEAGVYDGDTPPAERSRVRDRCHLVLTNPDMLNAALLPNHGRTGYAHLFRNVRYVVVDEVHSYRGAFGSHVANVVRRLLRVCKHAGSDPLFLCSSATIANAREHAEQVCNRPFTLIDRDGSPSAGKVVHFWQPPLQHNEQRKPVTSELAQLVPHLVHRRHRTIAFCRSRKETEIVLKEARDRLAHTDGHTSAQQGRGHGHDEAYLLAGYRGGYTPVERRQVERDLAEGRLLGVVSTNALELGIDIGALEIVVQGGFPGTRASFWQQLGRAGRRGKVAHGIVVLAVSPIDEFIAQDPDWLVGQPAEHAVSDPDNLAIQLWHVRAAAAELPLTLDDAALFPDLGEIVAVLSKRDEIRDVLGAWHWQGGPFPAGEFSLRTLDPDRFKVVDAGTQRTITEMDRHQVYREAHVRAVYLHDGIQYQVSKLDLVQHVATVVQVDQNFYTQPDVRSHIDVLLVQDHAVLPNARACFGDVRVDDAVVGYKMLEFHNHQNLGYEQLHEPLRLTLETEAFWVPVPDPVLAAIGRRKSEVLPAMVHAVVSLARLHTMAERGDLLGTSFHCVDDGTGQAVTAVICHDSHPGGLGYAQKAFARLDAVLHGAIALVEGCRCKSGCPACLGPAALEANGKARADKALVSWALRSWFETLQLSSDPAVTPSDRVPWLEVANRWAELVAQLQAADAFGAGVLAKVTNVVVAGERLILTFASPGLRDWLAMARNLERVRQSLASRIAVPDGWRLDVQVASDTRDEALRTAILVQRRHDDLVAARPQSETEADQELASGYVTAGQLDGRS